jgi:hypothetical protein
MSTRMPHRKLPFMYAFGQQLVRPMVTCEPTCESQPECM